MADVFGEAKRQREGQKLNAFGLSAVLAEHDFARATRFFIQFSGMLLKQ